MDNRSFALLLLCTACASSSQVQMSTVGVSTTFTGSLSTVVEVNGQAPLPAVDSDYSLGSVELGVTNVDASTKVPASSFSVSLGRSDLGGLDANDYTVLTRLYVGPSSPVWPYAVIGLQLTDPDWASIDPVLSVIGPQLGLRAGVGLEIPIVKDTSWFSFFTEFSYLTPLIGAQDEDRVLEFRGSAASLATGLAVRF
jgi:hypothetical protein